MLPYLITTEHEWQPDALELAKARGATGPADVAFALMPPRYLRLLEPGLTRRGETVDEPAAVAYVDAGRWVARCPFCPSAQVVHPDDPRFLCAGADGCANHPVAGAYVRLVFPAARQRRELERLLTARPSLRERNFVPAAAAARLGRPQRAETVADLRRENTEAGL